MHARAKHASGLCAKRTKIKESRGAVCFVFLCQQLALDPCWPALVTCNNFRRYRRRTINSARAPGSPPTGKTSSRLGTLSCLWLFSCSSQPAGCYRPSLTLRRLFFVTLAGVTAIRIAVPMFSVARGRYLQATVDGDRSLNPGRATNWKNFGNVKERLCFYSSHFLCQSLFPDFISLAFNDLQTVHRAVVRKMCSPVLGSCIST